MYALTTLINVDVETAPKLVDVIANSIDDSEAAAAFKTKCVALIEAAQTEALIAEVLGQTESILKERPQDAIGCFQALVSILFTIHDAQKSLSIVKSMIHNITAHGSSANLRLQILITLFNLLTNSRQKFEVIKAVLSFGNNNNLANVVSQLHDKVEGWIALWNLPVEDERALLKLIVESLSKSRQDLQSRKFLVRFLHTYDSAEFPADVQGIALEAALSAVKSDASAYEDRSLMLEGLSRQKNLFADLTVLVGLLRVLCTGTLGEYRAFQQQNAAALQRLGTNADQTLHTMRLMTLCAFCMGKQKVSYADIASRLEVDVADVEEWVVQAIASGLIDASMDQSGAVVHIARSFHGSFGKEQWQQLHARLIDWRRSVAAVLSTMKKQDSP